MPSYLPLNPTQDLDAEQGVVAQPSIPETPKNAAEVEAQQIFGYLQKPGIAMPPRKRFRLFFLVRWALAIAGLHVFALYLLRSMTTQSVWPISAGVSTIDLDVEHCNVDFVPGQESSVSLQNWDFLGGAEVRESEDVLHVHVEMSGYYPMFRCTLVVVLPPSSTVRHIRGHVDGEPLTRVTLQAAPSESVTLRAHEVAFEARELPRSLDLTITKGRVRLLPQVGASSSDVRVTSQHASLLAVASGPMEVTTVGMARNFSVFAAPSISTGGSGNKTYDDTTILQTDAGPEAMERRLLSGAPLKIYFETHHESPGYFLATTGGAGRADDESLQTLRGAMQDLDRPRLVSESATELRGLSKWMERTHHSSRPWVAKVRMRNPGLPCGSWQVVSSEAYLVVRLEWLALISGTLLQPDLQERVLQLVSTRRQWPPSDPESQSGNCKLDVPSDRRDPEMLEVFDALSEFLDIPEGAAVAWVPDGRSLPKPVVFKRHGDGWRTSYHKVFSGQSLLFLAALALNVLASMIGATVFCYFISKFAGAAFVSRTRTTTIAVSASQRITRRTTAQTWRVSATLVDSPHGVVLRWTKRTGEQRPTYLWIFAEAHEDPVRGLPYDEVCIERVKNEKVPAMRENSSINEFFFSVDQLCPGNVYDPSQRKKDLEHLFTYRFKIEACDYNENAMVQSEFSNEVFISPRMSVFDVPLMLVKMLCPVPTASLGYFLEHYADRHVNGKTPQQIMVLSDLKVTFHRNFRDLQDCNEPFYLTAFAGNSRDQCQNETYTGRVKTFDSTAQFTPPAAALEDNPEEADEEARTLRLLSSTGGNEIRIGRASDDVKQVTFRMHWAGSGDDVADAKFDWADLQWEFEHTADDDDKPPQHVEIDLVCESKETFDEEYLVYLRGRVSFESSIDSKCTEIDRSQRFFEEDSPGQVFYRGMERFISWESDSALLQSDSFDLYIHFPDLWSSGGDADRHCASSNPRLLSRRNTRSSVGVTIMIDFPDLLTSENCVAAQLYALDEQRNELRSHRFVICQTWLLSDMEMLYASFCKMNGMTMQQLSDEVMEEYGITRNYAELKVVPNLRTPMPFENQDILFETRGCHMIQDSNIVVQAADAPDAAGHEEGGDDKSTGAKTGSEDSKKQAKESTERTFVVTSQRLWILDSMWPVKSRFEDFRWVPSQLLVYDFYPVDNIIHGLEFFCQITKITAVFNALRYVFGAALADFLLYLLVSPFVYLLPFFAEGMLYLWQWVVFMSLPCLPLLIAGFLEFYKYAMDESYRIVSTADRLEECLPDLAFRSTLSGLDLEWWLEKLSPVSRAASFAACGMYVLLCFFLVEANVLRGTWPSSLQAQMRAFFNDVGYGLVMVCMWCACFFCLMVSLWFMMAVVIYPEQMAVAISSIGGLAFVGYSILTRYRATREQINIFLKNEVPDILDLVCDNFLAQYDREDLGGASQLRTVNGSELEGVVFKDMRAYCDRRFKGHPVQKLGVGPKGDPKTFFKGIFDRALLKREQWSVAEGSEVVKTTEQILNESGLTQEDSSSMDHFDMRIRLSDRETELRDKSVHQYSEDLRQKLMQVYVRCLEQVPLQEDVEAVLSDPKKLGKAIHRAHKAKLELFDETKYEGEGSLMQLFISDVNQNQLKNFELITASFLDTTLDAQHIAEGIAAFIWREVPADVHKELRLTLDEHCVGSAMQKVLERLRRWKNQRLTAGGDAELNRCLTLGPAPSHDGQKFTTGLMQMLQIIGVLDLGASVSYLRRVWNLLESKVRQWRDEDETELVVNSNDLENFIRELLKDNVWWGALIALLTKLGFPFNPTESATRMNNLPLQGVRADFEAFAAVQRHGGFLPKERVADFLFALTRAESTDGGCGRVWPAQMIKLMQKLQICGYVNLPSEKRTAHKKGAAPERRANDMQELAAYRWPSWLLRSWTSKAPAWTNGDGAAVNGMQPFLPKSELYAFLQDVAFMPEGQARKVDTDKLAKVDLEYEDWLKDKDDQGVTVGIWTKRGKTMRELRGVWQECFMAVLEQMSSEVADTNKGVVLFEICREAQNKAPRYKDLNRDGLLSPNFLALWLRENLVQNTAETSLQVFQKVLDRCELSLPKIVVTTLWNSATPSDRFEGRWALRKVKDLEDRLVMYLVKGLPAESVEALVFDVLSVPSLQDISLKELRTMFTQVDNKLGTNGFLEPKEVKALMTFMAQQGMGLTDLLTSLRQMGCDFQHDGVKEAFLLLDTSADDLMDMPEFLGLWDFILMRLIPDEIFRVMGLQPQQVVLRLFGAVFTLVAVTLFVVISLGAFHVSVAISSSSAGGGASILRVGITLLAVVALKRETTDEDEERFFKNAKERLYAIMGVTHSQIDARRRAMGIAQTGAPMSRAKGIGGFRFGGKRGAGSGDDDKGDDDGDASD